MCLAIIIAGCVAKKTTQTNGPEKSSTIQSRDIPIKPTFADFKNDTLQYLQKVIIDNKAKYVNKELSVLLSDLPLPVKTWMTSPMAKNRNATDHISLLFYDYQVYSNLERQNQYPAIVSIAWAKPIPVDTVHILGKKHKFAWKDDEVNFFGKQIVGDIVLGGKK